ncbi:fasciclin domain-containing protein [Ruegeria hyattellae]|uniref:fasciclin domain-containing protein n=1 Tax=Ruegeria hyattellae TaxID=3233337 RepID=UPI00355B41D2
MDTTQTLTGIVLNSGAPGTYDTDNGDFDLLRDAVITAGLADDLDSDAVSLTVFAPTDAAFIGLAQALGYGGSDESGSLAHIVDALTLLGGGDPIPLLTDVLTYHVVNGAFDLEAVAGLGNGAEIGTLQGGSVTLNLESVPPSLGDADDGIADPGLVAFDIKATNGIIHVLDGVLLPVSVTGILSQPNTDFILDDDGSSFNFTGRGNDFIDGNGGRDIIWAGNGHDIVLGGSGNDVIGGGWGKDILRGDEGHDKIFGGGGKDVIDGGDGNDYIFGGWGKDNFVFENGDDHDTILDFRVGRDKIDLTGYEGIDNFHDIEDHISGRFFRTVIDLDDGDRLSLIGVRAHQLDADDFLFA